MQWTDEGGRGDKAAGQFSTPAWVADLLASRLKLAPDKVADLGVGKGALALALARRFPAAQIIGVDKYASPRQSEEMMREAGIVRVRKDIGLPGFSAWFGKRFGNVQTVICNPPFTYIEDSSGSRRVLDQYGLTIGEKKQRLDLIFLAHAMALLQGRGEAAFILPVSAFSMSRSLANLKTMVSSFGLCELIKLPLALYSDAEVQTAILILRPNQASPGRDRFEVYSTNSQGGVDPMGVFSAQALIDHFGLPEQNQSAVPAANSIGALGGRISRGKLSSRELASTGVRHFHTTSFTMRASSQLIFDEAPSVPEIDVPASAGDILLPRVGTRCLGRSAIVVRGSRHISDCVLRVSTPPQMRHQLWQFLSSEAGMIWQLSLARGACAKFITQQDLLTAPLPVRVA